MVLRRALESYPRLSTVVVAPLTSAIRGAASEVVVGIDEGLRREAAVNLDRVRTVVWPGFRQNVGSLGGRTMTAARPALAIAVACYPTSE